MKKLKTPKKPRFFHGSKIQCLSHGTPENFLRMKIFYYIFSSWLGLSKILVVFGRAGFSGVLVQLRTSWAQNPLLWYKVKKSKCWPPKWIFRGKWCSTKLFPIRFHGEMIPRGRNLAVKKKSYDHFLVILCEFSGFLTKNRLFDPLQGVLNIECALNWIYLVKLTHGKVFKSHLESKFDP